MAKVSLLNQRRAMRWAAIATISVGLIGSGSLTPSFAVQQLKPGHDSFMVVLQTPLDATTNKTGDPFVASLQEPAQWGAMELPEGTRFEGHLSDVDRPKRLGMKPSMDLAIDTVYLPNGDHLSFVGRSDVAASHQKLVVAHKNGHRKWVRVTMMAAGLAVPFPFGIAARTGLGAVVGLFEPEFKGQNPLVKMGKGMYVYSPISTAVNMSRKQPNQHYNVGDAVHLAIPQPAFEQLATMAKMPFEPVTPTEATTPSPPASIETTASELTRQPMAAPVLVPPATTSDEKSPPPNDQANAPLPANAV
jgi:hypothetical protein